VSCSDVRCQCPVSANFPFCHSIVRVGCHLSLSFPRLAVSPDGARAAMQGAGPMVMPAGRLAEQSSLAQATPARRKNQANRASGLGCLVIQDSSLQVSDPCRGIFVVTGQPRKSRHCQGYLGMRWIFAAPWPYAHRWTRLRVSWRERWDAHGPLDYRASSQQSGLTRATCLGTDPEHRAALDGWIQPKAEVAFRCWGATPLGRDEHSAAERSSRSTTVPIASQRSCERCPQTVCDSPAARLTWTRDVSPMVVPR
jgi:hypothetical protein